MSVHTYMYEIFVFVSNLCYSVCACKGGHTYVHRYILTYLRMYIIASPHPSKVNQFLQLVKNVYCELPKTVVSPMYVSVLWQYPTLCKYPTILLINLPVICMPFLHFFYIAFCVCATCCSIHPSCCSRPFL